MEPEQNQLQQPIHRRNLNNIGEDHRDDNEMDFVRELDVSENEEEGDLEEPLAEEDYDPRMFEEQKERAQLVRGIRERRYAEFTVTQANSTQRCNASKLHTDAV